MGYLSCLCDGGEVSKVVAALLAIVCWYVVSTSLVVYNKWLFSTCPTTTSDDENCHFYGFHYPITTTMFHMITNAIVCRLIALVLKIPVPSVSEGFSWRIYLYYIVTLGAFTGGDIAMTNASFMFLAASYIEMIKSSVSAPLSSFPLLNPILFKSNVNFFKFYFVFNSIRYRSLSFSFLS